MTNPLQPRNKISIWGILLAMVFMTQSQVSFAKKYRNNLTNQTVQKITGTVSDENGTGLPGVSILKKGTTIGVNTDINGKYSIDANAGDILVFSFVGYLKEEITISNQTMLNVSFKPDTKALEEVVVTGYGNQKRAEFVGSSAAIKSATIQEMPVTSVESAMQGRMTGVQVQQSSGQPGAGVSIRVRGVTSIAGGNEPLFVIDGVPQYNNDNRALNGLSAFNSSDIESIEVLKDASATAIYGSRGANGVVQITTKKGKAGQNRITYDASFTHQTIQKKLNLMNGTQMLDFFKKYYANSNLALPSEVTNATNANTDWQDQVLRGALQQNHTLSFSGGTDKTQYYVSGNYLTQPGIILATNFFRGSLRFNLNTQLNSRVSLRTYMTVARTQSNGFSPSDNSPTRYTGKNGVGAMVLASPTVAPYNADGTYGNPRPFSFSGIDVENPLAFTKESLDRNIVTRFQGGMDFSVKLIEGLTNTARFGADYFAARADLYFPIVLAQLSSGVGIGQLTTTNSINVVAEDFLEYKKKLGKIDFEGVIGASVQSSQQDIIQLLGSKYINDDLKNYSFSAAGSVSKPVTDIVKNNLVSTFGRLRLNYKDRYLFSASIRRDGASVFSKNHKYGVFPSVGLAWRASEEQFVKNFSVISNLKIRGSWGQSGNPAIQPYQSLLLGNIINTAQGAGSGLAVGLSPTLPNDNLTWETTTQTNLGLDLGLANDKYRASFDYYIKNTTSLLATVQLAPSTGYNTIIDNVGEVQNKGFEFELGTDILNTKDLRWMIDANLSINKNKVVATKNNLPFSSGNSRVTPGDPLSAFYGPKTNGTDAKGELAYIDLNGDGIIDGRDNQLLGSPYPTSIIGITNSIRYKQFNFVMTWSSVQGNIIDNQLLFTAATPTPAYNRIANIYDYYPNPKASDIHRRSELFLEDGSYIRLRNIRLDYRIPMGGNKTFKSANVYVSGQNLFTITKYKGYDPEVNAFSGNSLQQGVDNGAYPGVKSITLGLSISL
ncbi:TonB-dependent receptor [Runella sp.]|uniref:SusC/RagA family TonB-linked outer membrane protein n=1 Tax=Runella sp. TaxID=1960881 RepID=UPI00261996ED|nr:TonB-dependent receptor [Runella sp.]